MEMIKTMPREEAVKWAEEAVAEMLERGGASPEDEDVRALETLRIVTATPDDKVRFSFLEGGANAMQHLLVIEVLVYVSNRNHPINKLVSNKSVNNISTLLTTTELVPARPTSILPPCTVYPKYPLTLAMM